MKLFVRQNKANNYFLLRVICTVNGRKIDYANIRPKGNSRSLNLQNRQSQHLTKSTMRIIQLPTAHEGVKIGLNGAGKNPTLIASAGTNLYIYDPYEESDAKILQLNPPQQRINSFDLFDIDKNGAADVVLGLWDPVISGSINVYKNIGENTSPTEPDFSKEIWNPSHPQFIDIDQDGLIEIYDTNGVYYDPEYSSKVNNGPFALSGLPLGGFETSEAYLLSPSEAQT